MSDAADPVRLGFTGIGSRGFSLLESCLGMSDVEVRAICNRASGRRQRAVDAIVDAARPEPATYDEHGTMVTEEAIDGVIISTPWEDHIPMAIEAMEAGVYVGLEVGTASSIEECWELVRTAERTGSHCMLLENCCYYRDCMAILQMVRAGIFGELVHAQCGYGHDLRGSIHRPTETDSAQAASRNWRGRHNERRNGDLYPTHGIGPIATMLNINHGNRFVSLTSSASKSVGLSAWAENNLDADHPNREVDWAIGDIVTTVLTCANGETVTVTHDVTLPRPYSNMYHLQGTGGVWKRTFERLGSDGIHTESAIYVEGESPGHEWESFESYQTQHEHPVWETYQERGPQSGSHGGIDYLTLRDYIIHVQRDARPPIDVYDTATWMAIGPLSEQSISLGNEGVAIPDFTNGRWMDAEPTFGRPESGLQDSLGV